MVGRSGPLGEHRDIFARSLLSGWKWANVFEIAGHRVESGKCRLIIMVVAAAAAAVVLVRCDVVILVAHFGGKMHEPQHNSYTNARHRCAGASPARPPFGPTKRAV